MAPSERLTERIAVRIASRFIDTAAGRLHCVVAGSGPPLVLVHGLNIGWGQWYAVLGDFARRHTVYALDLPGAGESFKINFLAAETPAIIVQALRDALEALVPQGAVVVGHSLGAWAALKLASEKHAAIRAMVAVSPVGFTDQIPPKFKPLAIRSLAKLLAATAIRPTQANIASFLGDVMADKTAMIPEYVDYVTEHVNRGPKTHPVLLIHRLFRPFRFREEFVFSPEQLGAIACPVMFLHGSADPLIPFPAVKAAFDGVAHARVEVLDSVGHVPPIERPGEFVRLVESFIADVKPT